MKKLATLVFAAVFVALNVGFAWNNSTVNKDDEEKPKYTTKQVMGKVFKGPKALKSKITKGTATEAEKKEALAYLEAMAKNKPKKGDAESWKKKTEALIKACKDVVAGKEGAVKALNAASNCKSCHNAHK